MRIKGRENGGGENRPQFKVLSKVFSTSKPALRQARNHKPQPLKHSLPFLPQIILHAHQASLILIWGKQQENTARFQISFQISTSPQMHCMINTQTNYNLRVHPNATIANTHYQTQTQFNKLSKEPKSRSGYQYLQ